MRHYILKYRIAMDVNYRRLYYFRKDSGLEVDFVMRYKGECVLVEVKASDGNTKSTRTILSHPEKYHVKTAIKLGDYNIGEKKRHHHPTALLGIFAEGMVIIVI